MNNCGDKTYLRNFYGTKQYASDEEKAKEAKLAWERLRSCSGIFIPGGYGNRGFRGKISAAKYARENKIPFFGVCFGF